MPSLFIAVLCAFVQLVWAQPAPSSADVTTATAELTTETGLTSDSATSTEVKTSATPNVDASSGHSTDQITTDTMFETTGSKVSPLPGWSQMRIGDEWAHRFSATGLYPENFMKVPLGETTEEERKHMGALQHYFMGSYYLELDNAGRAQEQFQEALALEPDNSDILLGLVRSKIAARELEDAEAQLNKLLTEDPGNTSALTLKAQTLMGRAEAATTSERKELLGQAVAAYEKARAAEPKNLDLLKGLAAAYVQQQNLEKIIQTYRDIVAVNSRDTYSLLILANVLSKTGHEQEAVAYYERVIEQRRGYINSYLLLGQLFEQMQRDKDALDLYKRALLIDTRNKDLLERFENLVARLAGSKGRPAILVQYEKFAKEYPNSSEIQRLYANRLLAEAEATRATSEANRTLRETFIKSAIEQFKHVLAVDPENSESLLALGQLLMQQKQFDEATKYFEKAVDISPDKIDVYDAIVAALLARKDRNRAVEIYQRAIERNQKAFKLYISLATLLEGDNQTTQAIEVVKNGLERAGAKPELHAVLGQLFEKNRNIAQATEHYAKAFDLANQNMPLYAKLFSLYVRSGQQAEAEALLKKGSDAAGEGKDTVLALTGEAYVAEGKVEKGIELLKQALEHQPAKLDYLVRLVQVMNQEKRHGESLALIDAHTAKVKDPDKFRLEQLRGDVYLQQKDFDKAIAAFRGLVQKHPTSLDNYQLLVDALNSARRYDEAFATIKQAEGALDKSNTEAVKMLRGITLYKQKKYDQAEKVFKELVRTPNGKPDEYQYMLGSIYMDQKRYDEAEKVLKQALEGNPTNANILNALGYMYAERGIKLQEARTLVTKALELNPAAPHILDSMGWVLFRLGKPAEARDFIERAAKSMQDAEIYQHLAEIYSALGEKDKAEEMQRKVQEAEPQSTSAPEPNPVKQTSKRQL
ncbi:MAG: tetratricopeptide repeat protein [Candidatus Sumerlaeaceae bacterium]